MTPLPDLHDTPAERSFVDRMNPIWAKSFRARLRLKHVITWGLVIVSITMFFCIFFYRFGPGRGIATPEESAKITLIPLVVIQSVILMLLGTGSVAVGLARERESLLLDYHRMTPMPPSAKILGYLFGLPVREYFLFLLTVPFLIWVVMAGNFSVKSILHFYLVFFSSVWVYHMTGLVAGMVSKKPRRAALMSQGLVVLLYLILPQFSNIGLTFFEYLTFRPTFYGMVMHEIESARPGLDQVAAQQFQGLARSTEVPFFTTFLHATTYSLVVQGFLLVSMYLIVQRRWRDQESHPFSKFQGMAFFGGVLFFLIGGLYPILNNSAFHERLFGSSDFRQTIDPRGPAQALILMVFQFIVGAGALVLIHTTTATKDEMVKALRRARKLGLPKVPNSADGKSSRQLAWFVCLSTVAACAILIHHVLRDTDYFAGFPAVQHWIAPLLLICALVMFFQGLHERFGMRVTFIVTFAIWVLPFFAGMILWAADDLVVLGSYVALPCPAVAQAVATFNFFEQAAILREEAFPLTPEQLYGQYDQMTFLVTGFYLGLAALVQVELRRWYSKLSRNTAIHAADAPKKMMPGATAVSPELVAALSTDEAMEGVGGDELSEEAQHA